MQCYVLPNKGDTQFKFKLKNSRRATTIRQVRVLQRLVDSPSCHNFRQLWGHGDINITYLTVVLSYHSVY